MRSRGESGELVRLIYRLGRQHATGVLTIRSGIASPTSGGARSNAEGVAKSIDAARRPDVFVLRRGGAIVGDGELARKALATRLASLAAERGTAVFESGVTAVVPPGAAHTVCLAGWARAHAELQLDRALAERLAVELARARLSVRPELAPAPADDSDRRMLAALAQPRRLDQIWPLARAPRFRLLALLHFLRAVGALELDGVAARPPIAPPRADPRRTAALRTLGIDDNAGIDDVKRAYRRLARALHPDLQPGVDGERRRQLERRFAEVTAAYDALA